MNRLHGVSNIKIRTAEHSALNWLTALKQHPVRGPQADKHCLLVALTLHNEHVYVLGSLYLSALMGLVGLCDQTNSGGQVLSFLRVIGFSDTPD